MTGARYGSATVSRIIDLDPFALPLAFLFPDATLEALGPAKDMLAGTHIDWAHGTILLAVQSHLIRFGGKTILLDACVGEHKPRPARPEWHQRSGTNYLANLAAAGCTPDDIDIVMCTHLHADHVGWNTRLDSGRWVPTFANARYLMSQTEIDHRASEAAAKPQANHGSFQDSVLPVVERGLVTTVEAGDEIVDGTRLLALPGHAPGQIGLEIGAGQETRGVLRRCHSQPGAGVPAGMVQRLLPRSNAGEDNATRVARTCRGARVAPRSEPPSRPEHAHSRQERRLRSGLRGVIY